MRDLTLEEFEGLQLETANAYSGSYDGIAHIKTMNKYLLLAEVDISNMDLSEKLEQIGNLKKKSLSQTSKATK